MHIHILGICGTFMGGIAAIAKQAGHQVTGCDTNVYPPMSDQLRALGIELVEGFAPDQLSFKPDLWVIGNVVSRGNPLMEAILDAGLPYISGPQWLAENVLYGKHVLAVAGTHGKTTTSSILAWILHANGQNPGFLIGGIAADFGVSARLSDSPCFVIEADEYDTAFFDKRSKFVHYRPRTAILNNLEFDHADIFADLAAIQTQFHHLVRSVPRSGRLIVNGAQTSLREVMARGYWSEREWFDHPPAADQASGWSTRPMRETTEHSVFDVLHNGQIVGACESPLAGSHNRANVLAAIAAARHVGVAPTDAIAALKQFQGVKRRLEVRGIVRGVTVIDDFAHHPTAIDLTVEGLRARIGPDKRILAVLEPRSNTMKLGAMKALLPVSLRDADALYCFTKGLGWDVSEALLPWCSGVKKDAPFLVSEDLDAIVAGVAAHAREGDQILVMSNGGFGGIHQKLLDALKRE
jgi:UDP-N-acetylmuramate: L-alanyl-gamma-D-glutamyl-meso-diaminopimelate ligase